MTKVLVVDDDPALLKALRIGLTARGDEVVTAHSGSEAINQVALAVPELVDPRPRPARHRRHRGVPENPRVLSVPIVVLSAYGDERRKVEALDSGADDFVTKPFGMAELEARLRVAMRHSEATGGGGRSRCRRCRWATSRSIWSTTWQLWPTCRCSSRRRSSNCLAYLARHAGKVCTHHMILKDVWGPGYGAESNYVRVYTHRLRKKLGDEGVLLKTVPGIGYQLVADSHPSASKE